MNQQLYLLIREIRLRSNKSLSQVNINASHVVDLFHSGAMSFEYSVELPFSGRYRPEVEVLVYLAEKLQLRWAQLLLKGRERGQSIKLLAMRVSQ